jgi:hypothetical protein
MHTCEDTLCGCAKLENKGNNGYVYVNHAVCAVCTYAMQLLVYFALGSIMNTAYYVVHCVNGPTTEYDSVSFEEQI